MESTQHSSGGFDMSQDAARSRRFLRLETARERKEWTHQCCFLCPGSPLAPALEEDNTQLSYLAATALGKWQKDQTSRDGRKCRDLARATLPKVVHEHRRERGREREPRRS